jgi:flagellar motor switch protein FliN/FliY
MNQRLHDANERRIDSWRDYLSLSVSLSFELGRTRLKFRELLEIRPDTILKLPRSTGEGVDVFADNQPLVRGEIVVLEDRAGVRINSVITQEDR